MGGGAKGVKVYSLPCVELPILVGKSLPAPQPPILTPLPSLGVKIPSPILKESWLGYGEAIAIFFLFLVWKIL